MVVLAVAAVASYDSGLENTEAVAVGNTAAVVVESYLVDENLKGDLCYLETQSCCCNTLDLASSFHY